jgi:hypothetical protein
MRYKDLADISEVFLFVDDEGQIAVNGSRVHGKFATLRAID